MLKNIFFEKLKENGLSSYSEKFEKIIRDTIRIYPRRGEEDQILIGASKIGGRPDLPTGIIWPSELIEERKNNPLFSSDKIGEKLPLSFIGQVNLNEISQLDADNLLPKRGILYFFYSIEQNSWGFNPEDKNAFKVIYWDGMTNDLQRMDFPEDLPKEAQYHPCGLKFVQEICVPPLWESDILNFLTIEEKERYEKLLDEEEINKMLGYADNIQNAMELECELVTNGLYCGDSSGYNDPRAKELEKIKNQWRLLLQVDSIKEAGMTWGDSGRLYFWVREKDLLEKKFDKSWAILQCY